MKKRGQLVYKALVTIIGSALIITGFLQAAKSYGSQEAFYKLAVAKDLALTIDLLHSFPGDVVYNYPNDVSGYDIEVKENTVAVYNTGNKQDDKTQGVYAFVDSAKNPVNTHIKNKRFLRLEKSNDKIVIIGVDK
ncbi:MAG: hypothetical protein AABX33_07885 [Nanoarchaeota archaeon]